MKKKCALIFFILCFGIAKAGLVVVVKTSSNSSYDANVNIQNQGWKHVDWNHPSILRFDKDTYGNIGVGFRNLKVEIPLPLYDQDYRNYSNSEVKANSSYTHRYYYYIWIPVIKIKWVWGVPVPYPAIEEIIFTDYYYNIAFYHWVDTTTTMQANFVETGTACSTGMNICNNQLMRVNFTSNEYAEWTINGIVKSSGYSLNCDFTLLPEGDYEIKKRSKYWVYDRYEYSEYSNSIKLKVHHPLFSENDITQDITHACHGDGQMGKLNSITLNRGAGEYKVFGYAPDDAKVIDNYSGGFIALDYSLSPGSHKICIQQNFGTGNDTFSCQVLNGFDIPQFDSISATISHADITAPCYDNRNAWISITNIAGGAGGPYTLSNSGNFGVETLAANINERFYTDLFRQTQSSTNIKCKQGCFADFTIPEITGGPPTKLQKPDLSIDAPILCHGKSSGTITGRTAGGFDKYRYRLDSFNVSTTQWENCIDTILSNKDPFTFDNLPSRRYILHLSDSTGLGCTETSNELNLSQPTAVIPAASISNDIDCNGQTGEITLQATGGTVASNSNYKFSIGADTTTAANGTFQDDPGFRTNPVFKNLHALNQYYFVAKDDNECIGKTSIELTEPLMLVAKFNATPVTCVGTETGKLEADISGGRPPISYYWTKETDDNQLAINVGLDAIPAKVGYRLYYSDRNNCMNYNSATFAYITASTTESAVSLALDIAKQDVTCKNNDDAIIILTGKGGDGNYTFKPDGGNYSSSREFARLAPNTYAFWVKDGTGCEDSSHIKIFQPEELTGTATADAIKCKGDQTGYLTVQPSGGTFPYRYSMDGYEEQIDTVFGPLEAGEYSIDIVDTNNCTTTIYGTIIEPDSKISVSVNKDKDTYCSPPSGEATAFVTGGTPFPTGAYLYQWNDSAAQTEATAFGLKAGIYTISASDANECLATSIVQILNLDGPNTSLDTVIEPNCFNESTGYLSLIVTGGTEPYFTQWSEFENGEWIDIEENSFIIQNMHAGIYKAYISDFDDCNYIFTHEVTQPEELIASVEKHDPVCYNSIDGSANGDATGGTAPYSFLWIDPNNRIYDTETVHELGYGTLSLIVSDSHNCSDDANVELINPMPIELDLPDTVLLCAGQTVELNPGEFTDYTWLKNDVSLNNEQIFIAEQDGIYTVNVTDANGCKSTKTISVSVRNDLLNAKFLMKDTAYVGDTMAIVDVSYPVPENVQWMLPIEFMEVGEEENPRLLYMTQAGIYNVTLNAFLFGCTDENIAQITVLDKNQEDDSKKNENFVPIKEVLAFPNPSNGIFDIDVIIENEGEILIGIAPLNSSAIPYLLKRSSGSDEYSIHYDITNLPAGTYTISVKTNGDQKSLKVVKQ